jgi:tetratricopeptide (TPR) repeat protein
LHALSGQIAQQQERFDDVHEAYAEALRRGPTLVVAWSNRATLWYQQGEIERAVEDLTAAASSTTTPTSARTSSSRWRSRGRPAGSRPDRAGKRPRALSRVASR